MVADIASCRVLCAWFHRGAAAMIEEDVAVLVGIAIGAFGLGYAAGLMIQSIKKFFEQV